MPSLTHESVVELLRECPWLALTLWRDLLGRPAPDGARVEDASAAISEVRPAEYRADQVLRVIDTHGQLFAALVVEVQLRRDPAKRLTWPHYVASVRARLACPVAVLVITIDNGVARWCAQSIDLGFGQGFVTPVVLGPQAIPRITDPEQARDQPELAILSVAAHARTFDDIPMATAALTAVDGLDNSRSEFYSDVILAFLSDVAPRLLEQFMDLENYKFKSEFARKYVALGKEEGRREGRTEGLRQSLRTLLEQKFGTVDPSHQDRIDNATQDDLERWLALILEASTVDAVFTEKQ